jgi:hypothetical protein
MTPWRAAVAGLVVVAMVVVLRTCRRSEPASTRGTEDAAVVRLVGPSLIEVAPESPLAAKLDAGPVASETIATPLLTVTGSVVARLGAGKDSQEGRWDFSQPELAASYADWLRARADEPFTAQQLEKTRQLVAARVSAQTKAVERLRRLVQVGTDSQRDLAKAEADLVETQLDGQKQVFEADAAAKNAARARATLERQLFQAGIDPGLLGRATDGTAIVVADVPEGRVGLVRAGQVCEARFLALPGQTFTARVSSLAPSLARERQTLRVFFELDDPQLQLRPGMFAEVGLGTDPRAALLVPSDAVLHVGRADYVLVQTDPGHWRVTEVQVAETRGSTVELLGGIAAGDVVIRAGAILLKPIVVQALRG